MEVHSFNLKTITAQIHGKQWSDEAVDMTSSPRFDSEKFLDQSFQLKFSVCYPN